MGKIYASVGILTFNSEKTLQRALESVKDLDEILVSDGGSTDETLEIAKQYNCKILSQDSSYKDASGKIIDFSCARNQLLENSTHDWFLFIDSDEYVSEELIFGLESITNSSGLEPAAYWAQRKYTRDGTTIDCATTYPNKQIRFFHKKAVNNFIKKVHERIEVKAGFPTRNIEGVLYVPFDESIKEVRKKWDHYISIECERMGPISFGHWLFITWSNTKVSTLYILRFMRNLFLCRGKRMPLIFELERHLYHIKLSSRLLKNIRL